MRRKPTEAEIAAHAYELYAQHGARDGRAMSDWLQAKRELEAAEMSAESAEVRSEMRPRRKQQWADGKSTRRRRSTSKNK
jgi:hypothetical protein